MVTIHVQWLNKSDGFVSQYILRGPTAAEAFSQVFAIPDLAIREGDKFVFTQVEHDDIVKPCYHPRLGKEYYLGTQTGDYICGDCGETFMSKEAARQDAERQRREKD